MRKRRLLMYTVLALALAAVPWWFYQGSAHSQTSVQPQDSSIYPVLGQMRAITRAQREAAAKLAESQPGASALKQSAADILQQSIVGAVPVIPLDQLYLGIISNYANTALPTVNPTTGAVTGGVRKFVDTLPGLGIGNANNLGQYLPVAVADTTTFPGSDYYKIGVVDYIEKMHSDIPPSKLRGYVDLGTGVAPVAQYLGPVIIAQKDRPVRILATNQLALGTAGNFSLPVDTAAMGAGTGPNGGTELYTQNRAVVHLHGGVTPWISDGTPHQWITPAGETTSYPKGASAQNVPDMPAPPPGSATYYYTNQQSGRLMFYHEHALGVTRIGVYAGEAAGYLIYDQVERDLIEGTNVSGGNPTLATVLPNQGQAFGGVYHFGIPLIIQDKTFVPPAAQLATQDPTWDTTNWGTEGNLWFPHVYMPNQNPNLLTGVNPMGRWDYGPWFWPPLTTAAGLQNGPLTVPSSTVPGTTVQVPNIPNPSQVPESFMDTPLINGTAYPSTTVEPTAYRFRILNAANDRGWNLGLYYAMNPANTAHPICDGLPGATTGAGCTEVSMVPATPKTATTVPALCTQVTATGQAGMSMATLDPATGLPINGTGLPAGCWPTTWATDGRVGGVPDPATAGPPIIQIGTEGGWLPQPAIIPSTPVNYDYNRRSIVVTNVFNRGLFLGPAERADVIIDFSQVRPGAQLIFYNDAPAPTPAFDTRYDYFTGDGDQTSSGGAPNTIAGYGPNTRTIMQIKIDPVGVPTPAFNLRALSTAWTAAYAKAQPAPVINQTAFGGATDTYSRIQDTSLTFTPVGSTTPITQAMKSKAIQELFELKFGRMNATLGTELPLTNFNTQTTIPLGYIDPATEITHPGTPQLWKITHNGVDTHSIHFHLFNVQLINRVGWDGAVRAPDPNEVGWKETVKMNPLEDAIVAVMPFTPQVPFTMPDSVRYYDPTQAPNATMGFSGVDPYTNLPVTTKNIQANYGNEYVWHCHLLGHEENDMMRPLVYDTKGKTQLFWRNIVTGENDVWIMDGLNNLMSVSRATTLATITNQNWEIVGAGDFNGDSQTDLIWRNKSTGENDVWFLNQGRQIGGATLPPTVDQNWQIVGVGDFNGDGKPDILWRNSATGANAVWFMNGTTRIGGASLPSATDLNWKIVGVGDFNRDGKPDIVWRNTATGANAVWFMNGVTRTGAANLPALTDQNWQIVGIGDFNNDCETDILWRNSATGANSVWLMNGTTFVGTASIPAVTSPNWKIVGH